MNLINKKEEINELREKIYAVTANQNILYKNEELINLSKQLDVLINEYISMSSLKKDL
ncbi:Spo0E family sporulation regulatory protein-aspartic acid phosphatase [Tepidibacter aestuarii]|uniref:Spo0E family sporulation regulatory protein-aspartic acid phosphatase n=1 Tax=Tepidibacter aestuarii TaxID=2925782 RepID=UPI0020BECE30|nr:Spo0E family sporulation regulatory protein-aspartic acid phosphatase [Tepidibacter aestuarii]CAH2213610.1 Spo0E like sporulation regulatory protein [Tepidibacter aestuarii]